GQLQRGLDVVLRDLGGAQLLRQVPGPRHVALDRGQLSRRRTPHRIDRQQPPPQHRPRRHDRGPHRSPDRPPRPADSPTGSARSPARMVHAYHASLTSQETRGTNRARPNASPQPNDARRLRPVSATTSSAGPAKASGHASTGGNAANSASPPATEISNAQRVLNPPKHPARPDPLPVADAAWTEITVPA